MLPERGRDGLPHRRVGDAHLPDAPGRISGSPDGTLIRTRLARLLQWLDRQMDAPIDVVAGARSRTVWVFGAIGYHVNGAKRYVKPVRRAGGGVVQAPYTVDLVQPLCSPDWLPFILREEGLSDYGPQRHLFRSDRSITLDEGWISREAYERLLADQRFRNLRTFLLPSALALDPELLQIARACRDTKEGGTVNSSHYSLIWRHERAFRTAARDSASLLPLAFAAVQEGEIDADGDLVAQLHVGLRARGVSRGAWRNLVQHGEAFLLPVLRHFDRLPLDDAASFLRALSAARITLPSSDAVLSLWLRHWPRRMSLPELAQKGEERNVPSQVLGAYLREGQRVAGTQEALTWAEHAPVVLRWARDVQPRLDKLQRRAGWPWLLRQARNWERRQILLRHEGPRVWPGALECFEAGGYRATAIGTLEALVDEGAAFHNCLGTLASECQGGYARFFAVRCARTGARVAVAAIAWHSERGAWLLGNLKGPANTDVPLPVHEFGIALAAEYASCAAHLPPPPSDPMAELFAQVACEMVEDEHRAGPVPCVRRPNEQPQAI